MSAPGPIDIVIVDDHAVFREGLRALISRVPGMRIVGEAATTQEAVESVGNLLPEVVLMDLHLPGGGGVEATGAILAEHPQIAVLVLTMHSDDVHVRQAIRAGARGYLLKDAEPEAIIRGIHAVHDRQLILDPGVVAHLVSAAQSAGPERPFPILTDREAQILDRIARGLRNDAIAARMGLSLKTVQNNVSNILLKLGVVDRAQLVALARDRGLGC